MISAFSWQNSVSLCPASFCTLACYSRYFLTSYFYILVLYNAKDILFYFFWCQFQKVLQVFIEPFNFFASFSGIGGWGIDLDSCETEWFALEMNKDHSVVFLYFFALIAEEGFLISSCYSLELCIQLLISFLFSFAFHFSSFHSYLQGLLRQPFCFFAFPFLGVVIR